MEKVKKFSFVFVGLFIGGTIVILSGLIVVPYGSVAMLTSVLSGGNTIVDRGLYWRFPLIIKREFVSGNENHTVQAGESIYDFATSFPVVSTRSKEGSRIEVSYILQMSPNVLTPLGLANIEQGMENKYSLELDINMRTMIADLMRDYTISELKTKSYSEINSDVSNIISSYLNKYSLRLDFFSITNIIFL